jgi:hypothetical protein
MKHSVINDQLAPPVEKFRERSFTVATFKRVVFGYEFPREFPSLLVQFVTEAGKLFFFDEKCSPLAKPFLVGYHTVISGDAALFSAHSSSWVGP